jgi:hypothetical protein
MSLPLFDLGQIMRTIGIVPLGYFNMQMNGALSAFHIPQRRKNFFGGSIDDDASIYQRFSLIRHAAQLRCQ